MTEAGGILAAVRRYLVLVAAILGLAAPASALPGGDTGRPAVYVRDLEPLTVVGARFRPAERVRVVVWSSGRFARAVTSDGRGRFVVRFRGVHVDECASYLVRATGAAGSRAVLKPVPPPCPPLQPADR